MLKNLHIKIIALLSAITFWGVIVTTQNTYFVFAEKLTPQVFNVDEGLAIAGDLTPVAVTVRTSADVFRQLTESDFKISVDAQDLPAGEHTVSVTVTTKKADVSIISIEPAQIAVTLETMANVKQQVSLQVHGEPAKNYAVGDITALAPTVAVSGAESIVEKLVTIQGSIQLASTETTNFVSHVVLEALDQQGNPLSLKIEPAEIDVIIPILQVVQSKTVGVKAEIQNTLENTFVESVIIEPDVISITGEVSLLQEITYISTVPIMPQQIGINITTVALDLPEGVTVVDHQSTKVYVEMIIADNESLPSS